MKKRIIWAIKTLLAVGLFFPVAYGTFWGLFLLSGHTYAWIPFLAFAAGVYITLVVLIFRFGRKKQQAQEGLPQEKAQARKTTVKQGAIFFTVVAAVITLILTRGLILDKLEKMKARIAYRNADEIVCYQNDRDICVNIMTTPLSRNSVLIDYDRMTVSVIYYMSYEKMEQVSLRRQSESDIKDPVQFQYELSGEGKMLRVYGEWTTSGVSVETADGGFWYGKLDNDFIGFDRTAYQNIAELENNADEFVEYAADSQEPFDKYGTEVIRNTAGIDYDTMTVYLVYGSESVVYGDAISMQKNGTVPDGEISAAIHFSKGVLYAYKVKTDFAGDEGRCDGLVFVTNDNEVYCSPGLVWGYYDMSLGKYAVR